MPYYDLHCEKCQNDFNVKASVQDRTAGRISCPACGSRELSTIYRKVNILRYKGKDCDVCPGSGAAPQGGCCGGLCQHNH